jgi:hypothetical protein
MVQIVLVGLGAGAAAALLFASVVSGSLAAVFLFYLAPLPILIAALGWSHLAGLIAAASATAVSAIIPGVLFIAVPVLAFGAWWLGYLALLARPATANGAALDWYPVGRLVLWAAVIGTLMAAVVLLHFGTDLESIRTFLRKSNEGLIPDPALIDILVVAVPPTLAVFSTVVLIVNLWLAARVVNISGRLKRPWPDIAARTLPPLASGLLAVALAGSLLPDLPGVLAGAFAASLLMVFAILGLAVMHAITRGVPSRPVILAGLYAATIAMSWLLLPIALFGLADALLDVRGRLARKRGPPSSPT